MTGEGLAVDEHDPVFAIEAIGAAVVDKLGHKKLIPALSRKIPGEIALPVEFAKPHPSV